MQTGNNNQRKTIQYHSYHRARRIDAEPITRYQRMGITAAVALVVLIFFGYQYFKRFRDEFTLFAILADLTIIEYAAPLIVDSGFPLWAAFGIIQIVYVIIRDLNDDSSGIRWFLDTMSGNR